MQRIDVQQNISQFGPYGEDENKRNEACHKVISIGAPRYHSNNHAIKTRHKGLASYANSYTYDSSRRSHIRVLKFTKQGSKSSYTVLSIVSKSPSYRPASYRLSILHKQLHTHRSIALFPSTRTKQIS